MKPAALVPETSGADLALAGAPVGSPKTQIASFGRNARGRRINTLSASGNLCLGRGCQVLSTAEGPHRKLSIDIDSYSTPPDRKRGPALGKSGPMSHRHTSVTTRNPMHEAYRLTVPKRWMVAGTGQSDKDFEDERKRIMAELATIGLVLPGSVTARSSRCGNPGCSCHDEPPRLHGPYQTWTRKVGGKTMTRNLTNDQVERYATWFDDARRLRSLVAELKQLSLRAAPGRRLGPTGLTRYPSPDVRKGRLNPPLDQHPGPNSCVCGRPGPCRPFSSAGPDTPSELVRRDVSG